MVRQSRDGLGKYKYLLKQIDILVRKVRSNKQLSFKQKNESIEELGLIRKKIIDGFDLKDIEKGAQLAKSEAAIQVYKELDERLPNHSLVSFFLNDSIKVSCYHFLILLG
jgi:hypothetical protein